MKGTKNEPGRQNKLRREALTFTEMDVIMQVGRQFQTVTERDVEQPEELANEARLDVFDGADDFAIA